MQTYAGYRRAVHKTLWKWAELHHRTQLDGSERRERPPVLAKEYASLGILVPPDDTKATAIRAAIPKGQRHRWFRSLASSQSLTQSVFGAIGALSRLDVLQEVPAECGRPAFFDDHRGWSLALEYDVRGLGEPRPTSIDTFLRGPHRRVAVECKFTEQEFGSCSRPRLRPSNASYAEQYCDGAYRAQRGRRERCALTEIGVRYWEFLPLLFDWSADRDHVPCPLGDVYQLARNALAAVVSPDGTLDPSEGHALVIYDGRNPQFRDDGMAANQWKALTGASRVPGLVRRLSWQQLVRALGRASELSYLVDGLERKYGLKPEY